MALFTPETAADMAKRSWESRRLAEAERLKAEQEAAANPQPAPETLDFAKQRLIRVRTQLDRLDAMAAEELDTKRLKELADATSRLQEQERQLAGRPLPGTLKPSQAKQRRPEPMPEPTPAIQQVVVHPTPEQGK